MENSDLKRGKGAPVNKNLSTKNISRGNRILSKAMSGRNLSDDQIDQIALATFRDIRLLLSIDPNTSNLSEDARKKLKELQSNWSIEMNL